MKLGQIIVLAVSILSSASFSDALAAPSLGDPPGFPPYKQIWVNVDASLDISFDGEELPDIRFESDEVISLSSTRDTIRITKVPRLGYQNDDMSVVVHLNGGANIKWSPGIIHYGSPLIGSITVSFYKVPLKDISTETKPDLWLKIEDVDCQPKFPNMGPIVYEHHKFTCSITLPNDTDSSEFNGSLGGKKVTGKLDIMLGLPHRVKQ